MIERLYRCSERAGNFLERHSRLAASILLAIVFFEALAQAAGKPFWYDEIFTWSAAALPGWSGVWNFYAQGADTPSPLPSLLVHGMMHFHSSPEIIARIPFILAFTFMCLCLYIFIRRRYPAGFALTALLAPVALPSFFYYSSESRAYPLLFAGVGFAAICWQSAQHPGKRPGQHTILNALGLWLGLAFAIFAHTFAIFLFVPFALAQLVTDLEAKKLNLPVWIALLLFPIGLVPGIRGELIASHAYRLTFFAKPGFHQLLETYKVLLSPPTAVFLTMLLFSIFALLTRGQTPSPENAAHPANFHGLTRAEVVFAATLALMPVYVLPASMLLGLYRYQYATPFLIGTVLCIVAALAEFARKQLALGFALIIILLIAACGKVDSSFHWRGLAHPGHIHADDARAFNQQAWVQVLASSNLPIVIADTDLFMRCNFYCDPSVRSRVWYVTDLGLARTHPESVTDQLNFIRANKYFPVPTMDWRNFSAANPHFLLVVHYLPDTWFPTYLAHQPRSRVAIQLLGPDFTTPTVYDVQISPNSARPTQ